MSLLLYAITDGPPTAEESAGIDGRPLRAVTHDGLVAVVGERPVELDRSAPALLAYERALEGLMADATILPVRFGTAIESPVAVQQLLSDRHEDFEASLGRVRGAVELTLHATLTDDEPGNGDSSGTAYMRRLLELRRRARRVASEIKLALAELVRTGTYLVRSDPEDAVAASFLVDDDQVDRFLERLRELEDACDDATFVCTGPWPPYSFAEPESL